MYLYPTHHRDIETSWDSELSNISLFMKTQIRSEPHPGEAPSTPAEKNIPRQAQQLEHPTAVRMRKPKDYLWREH